jgi:hypothetical protein
VLVARRWRELVTGQNGGTLFDRSKPTAGCSANEKRRRRRNYINNKIKEFVAMYMFVWNKTVTQTKFLLISMYPVII